MWWIILIILILISIILGIIIDSNLGEGVFAFGCSVLVFLFLLSSVFRVDINEYEEKQYEIQGLENNIISKENLSGDFILGFGYINGSTDEEIKYYYFKVNENGKKLETITIDNSQEVYIRETNEIKPCLIYKYQTTVNTGFFRWLFGEDKVDIKAAEILVVPTDTIKIEYNVEVK
ncbi:hypothetical protein [uncultured Thomasclavelia sp.]|uniref:hypothetical protein n=1 Tax=uncultured Thomasclavelia sp. TaxID=3025759 RepID=UPI0025982996|nr:hypothetical protein [uncultured Thomasclavelia sp.]